LSSSKPGRFGQDILNSRKYAVKPEEDSMIDRQIRKDIRQLVDSLPLEQKEVFLFSGSIVN